MTFQSNFFKSILVLLFSSCLILITACEKEEIFITDIESLTEKTVDQLNMGTIGKLGCLEFVFPVTIQFIDGSTAEATSYDDLKSQVRTWFEANDAERNRDNKPELVYPIQVVNQDGDVLDVEDKEGLMELKNECPDRRDTRRRGEAYKCFSLVFPVSLTIDGVDTSFDDQQSLKDALKAHRQANGRDAEKPSLVFPLSVEHEDGSQISVNSQDELRELKKACREE